MSKWGKIILLIIFIFSICIIKICADEFYDSFDTVELTDDQKQRIWRNSEIRKLGTRSVMENPSPIINFDVSASGLIVLALEGDKILVLDTNGTPIQSFAFDRDGSYCVGWHQDNVLLYSNRSDICIEFSLDGELVNMIKHEPQSWESSAFIREWQEVHPIVFDDNTYTIENRASIFNLLTAQRYAKLIKIDSNGNEVVLYDATYPLWSSIILIFGFIYAILGIVFFLIYNDNKQKRKIQQ